MANIRERKKIALLIVDMQVGVLRNTWETSRIIDNIRALVDKARNQSIPIIWVQHSDEELVMKSSDWQIVSDLSPAEGELKIQKRYNSSFEQTPLEETLDSLGINHIVLAGAATNWCIRATAYSALERGYDLTLIGDAHTTETIELDNGVILEAEIIIRELNMVMDWLGYPGRTNKTVSVNEVDFAV